MNRPTNDVLDALRSLGDDLPAGHGPDPRELRRRGERRRRRSQAMAAAGVSAAVVVSVLAIGLDHGLGAGEVRPVAPVTPAPVLRHDGYGELRLGMSLKQARATGHVTAGGTADLAAVGQLQMASVPLAGGCRLVRYYDAPVPAGGATGGFAVAEVSPRNGVVQIFAGEGVRTVEGVHIGMPQKQADARYPGALAASVQTSALVGHTRSGVEVYYTFAFTDAKVSGLLLMSDDASDCLG